VKDPQDVLRLGMPATVRLASERAASESKVAQSRTP